MESKRRLIEFGQASSAARTYATSRGDRGQGAEAGGGVRRRGVGGGRVGRYDCTSFGPKISR